jgi:hypothetical protein
VTAAVVERPRVGQVWELTEAIRAKADDPETAPYWEGFIVGFVATFATDDVFADSLTDARNVMFAGAHTVTDAAARIQLLGRNLEPSRAQSILRACGVLFGWKQGTAERPDAEECVVCDSRILTDVDTEAQSCTVGHFCNEECHRSYDGYRCCPPEPWNL